MTLSRRARLRVFLGGSLGVAFAFFVANPGGFLREGLRDNLVSETIGAAFTLLVVDLLFEAEKRREENEALREFRRSLVHTLDVDLHALWALLVETLAREDPFRQAPRASRIRRFLDELSRPSVWEAAPPGHAKAVRGRLRDLGEDAERLLVLSENVAPFHVRAHLDAVRRACRTMDEEWERTPRGELHARFAREIRPEVEALLKDFAAGGA